MKYPSDQNSQLFRDEVLPGNFYSYLKENILEKLTNFV